MSGQKKTAWWALALGAVALAGVALVVGDPLDPNTTAPPEDMIFRWDAPTTGTTPVKYEVEIRVGGKESKNIRQEEVTTNQIKIPVDWLTLHEVRARAVDSAGRKGPWSEWSLEEDRDHDAPSF